MLASSSGSVKVVCQSWNSPLTNLNSLSAASRCSLRPKNTEKQNRIRKVEQNPTNNTDGNFIKRAVRILMNVATTSKFIPWFSAWSSFTEVWRVLSSALKSISVVGLSTLKINDHPKASAFNYNYRGSKKKITEERALKVFIACLVELVELKL